MNKVLVTTEKRKQILSILAQYKNSVTANSLAARLNRSVGHTITLLNTLAIYEKTITRIVENSHRRGGTLYRWKINSKGRAWLQYLNKVCTPFTVIHDAESLRYYDPLVFGKYRGQNINL